MNKGFLLAIGLLAGTIIGAGIFSLPYIFSRVGVWSGFFYLIGFTGVYFFIHYMYARVLGVQEGDHQIFYLAHKYFKAPLAKIISFIILAELILVLTVYLILAPTFINLVFNFGHATAFIIFWLVSSFFIFMRLSWQAFAEVCGTFAILAMVFIIFGLGGSSSLTTESFKSLNLALFFLPFGPILFSLSGRPALHKLVEEYKQSKQSGKSFSLGWAIFWGTVIPAIIYFGFVIGILRLNPNISPETMDSLGFLPSGILALFGVLGFLALWTSYFMVGVNVRDIIKIDLKQSKLLSGLVVLVAPALLYIAGLKNFLGTVSFTGGVFLALESIFVIAFWRRAFPRNKFRFLATILYLIFFVALGQEIISHF